MKKKHPLLTGALILTLTGVATRVIGFFYKIFLSRIIGAEGLGIYQMIFPLFGICFSLTAAGMETSISRFVAGENARGHLREARRTLLLGMLFSCSLALLIAAGLYRGADFLAVHYLKEPRCSSLLRFLSLSLPFSACHACICGYYYGLKKTKIPSVSQLLEQLVRVGGVFLLACICQKKGLTLSPALAVLGLAMGEFASTLFCLTALSLETLPEDGPKKPGGALLLSRMRQLLSMALPLTGNRVVMNVLTSLESVLLPLTLQAHGMDSSAAYSIYGTLTGMALPFILFPNVLTSSISVLLLPSVSEAQSAGNQGRIFEAVRKTIGFFLPFGCCCTCFFLLTGHFLGNFFYQSTLAGDFIVTLAWICPFLYLNATLNSILHGLGRTAVTLRNNVLGITVRILFVLLSVPLYGIRGYLWGLLANQLLVTLLCLAALRRELSNQQRSAIS